MKYLLSTLYLLSVLCVGAHAEQMPPNECSTVPGDTPQCGGAVISWPTCVPVPVTDHGNPIGTAFCGTCPSDYPMIDKDWCTRNGK